MTGGDKAAFLTSRDRRPEPSDSSGYFWDAYQALHRSGSAQQRKLSVPWRERI